MNAVSDLRHATEAEVGEYLRREGLYAAELEEWKGQMMASLEAKSKAPSKDERDEKIKQLEREILRKDKALAEASALLILQKKAALIWGGEDPK